MSSRPVIGICSPVERARWGAWDQESFLLPRNYVDMAREAVVVLMLPLLDPVVTENPDEVLDLLDGLVLAGGPDVDPATYGAPRHPKTDRSVRERDDFELALTSAPWSATSRCWPSAAEFRPANVARGGTLIQHLPDQVGHEDHRRVRDV